MNFRHFLFLLLVVTGLFSACTKSTASRSDNGGGVRIRILNKTSLPATDAVLGSQPYGTIQPGDITAYHSFTRLIGAPSLTFYNSTTEVSLSTGICGSPLPPELEDGNYLYILVTDNTSPYGCTFSFEKE